MKARAQSGFTLLELLVAMTLLSLVAVGVLFGLRIGLSAMERTNDRMQTNRKVLGVERVITQQIAGFIPAKGDCQGEASAAPARVAIFQGEPQTMRFVSTYSLDEATRGYPRLLEYQVIPGDKGEGVRLIVNEIYYTGPFSTIPLCTGVANTPLGQQMLFRPVAVGTHSYVLADRLASCQFGYKLQRELPQPDVWLPRWTGGRAPSAIRMDMTPLATDPSRLEVPSIIAPVRVNRDPTGEYRDYEP